MLKMRIITALILISAVVGGIFYMTAPVSAVVLTLICLLAAYEWLHIVGARLIQSVSFYALLLLGCYSFYRIEGVAEAALGLALVGWGVAFVWILAYQKGHVFWPRSAFFNTVIGLWVILPMWAGLYLLLNQTGAIGPQLTLFLLVIIWSADICAYFSGPYLCRHFGRHLLASRVSPGKTWEGVLGAFIGTGLIAYGVLHVFFATYVPISGFFILVLIIVAVSIVGDLFESMVKRNYGKKDSSQLLPGHGGVLDRLDSLTAAAPVFAWAYFQFFAG